jgi:hypothetical protein
MKLTSTKTRRIGKARHCLALVMLAIFGHAVALHLLHAHVLAAKAQSSSYAADVSTPHDAPAHESHSSEHCPACQLQHGFASLDTTPAVLCLDVTASAAPESAARSAAQRIAEGSASCRAPPAL